MRAIAPPSHLILKLRFFNMHWGRNALDAAEEFIDREKSLLNMIRDFKIQRRGRQRERQKKPIGLISKTTTLHVHHAFLYISLLFLYDYDVKMPNFAFYRGRKQATTKLFLSLAMDPWNSVSGGFAYIWQSKCVGIIAILIAIIPKRMRERKFTF